MSAIEYLLRVKPGPNGQGFSASVRQLSGCAHPEVRAVLGPVSHGRGATEHAAMVSAVAEMRLGATVREVRDRAC